MRVLFAASEAMPFSKTGGLADVAYALPKALGRLDHDLRVVTPAYRGTLERLMWRSRAGTVELRGFSITIWEGVAEPDGTKQWLIDCAALYPREGYPYTDAQGEEYADNALRFGVFSELVSRLALGRAGIAWRPDVVHLNDWHCGLAAAWLGDAQQRPRSVFTIHNLAYQGNYPPASFAALGLPAAWMHPGGLEFHGQASFLKAGLVYADALTTVSPTYAQEILTPEFGSGMDGMLRGRASALTGILNGIDVDSWNPATDPHLERRYDAGSIDDGKRINRHALQRQLGLAPDDDSLLAVFIGRFAHQKGVDLLLDAVSAIDRDRLQFAFLGSGDRSLERACMALARRRPGRVAVSLGFDEALAHRMEAAADALLMPSRFEPCGLNQMYSQRYGTVPVVRATGGLADTVIDATPATLADGTATGFCFAHADTGGVAYGIGRALQAKRHRQTWSALQRNGMQRDFGWARTANRYVELYETLRH